MEYKSRGKVKGGGWVYGYYVQDEEWAKHYIYYQQRPDGLNKKVYWTLVRKEVLPASVGMFTGKEDKNKKEIYGGDILTNGDIRIKYVVEWVDCGLRARQISNQSTIGLTYWQDRLEIIGNLTDNPELLEGITILANIAERCFLYLN